MIPISEEIKTAHKRLSKTGVKFLEFVEKNPWSLKRSLYDNLQWPYRKILFQPWPFFIDQHFKKEVAEAGISVYNLIKEIPKKIFNFDAREMGGYFEIPGEVIEYILHGVTEGHIHHLLGRGDYIYSSTHGFKCLEYNIAGNLGGWELPFWHSMYRQSAPLAKFFEENTPGLINENLVEVALRLYVKRIIEVFPNHENEINTAMVMAGHQDGTSNYPLENYSC
ncbi:MAG TPA: hypothetical protein VK186_01495, partial [Candidatus Deferrimicrobium sp.]|nr:hypothetical protein [Candidatus Deferrimicrobium sp.]